VRHDWKMQAYWRLPVFLQNLALSAYGARLDQLYYGREYSAELEAIRSRSWTSSKEIEYWQMAEFRRLFASAVVHVAHYRALQKVDLDAFRAIGDLAQLPVLERQAVRQHEMDFVDDRLDPRRLYKDKTSGSTGTSLTVYWARGSLRRLQAALEGRVRNVAGVSRTIPRAMLGGRPIVPGGTRRPPYWRYNRFWKQLYLSSYHVSRETAPLYVAALRKSGVQWITGYGSAIAALAEGALEAGVPPLPMRCVVVSGDTLQPGMRRSIEEFFQCRCYDSYGQVEGVSMAMECAEGRLHLVPEVGMVEVVRDDGRPCAPGEVGEMLATGLLNEGMPFVRYRTGDFAAYDVDQSCRCASMHPIIARLEGRVDDYLVTADGRRIGRLSTAVKRSPSIHSAQIVQDRGGHAFLLIRPGDGYRREDALAVQDDIVERIGAFDFDIVEVGEIPKTPTGKTRLVVRLSERPELADLYQPLLAHSMSLPRVPRAGRL